LKGPNGQPYLSQGNIVKNNKPSSNPSSSIPESLSSTTIPTGISPTSTSNIPPTSTDNDTTSITDNTQNTPSTTTNPSPLINSVPLPVSPVITSSSSSTIPDSTTPSISSATMHRQPIIRYTPQNKQIPISNGGIGPGYWWSQTLTEITIHVEFPDIIRAKDIIVNVKPQYLTLGLQNKIPILDGPLEGKVQHSDIVWNLEGQSDRQIRPIDPTGKGNAGADTGVINASFEPIGSSTSTSTTSTSKTKVLTLVMDKIVETWWKSIIPGHPEIDPTAVDSTLPVDAYDPDTQAAIRKVMFDQQQKAQGLPTSEEIQKQAILERAKNLPGSPFLPDGPLATSVSVPLSQYSNDQTETNDWTEVKDDDFDDST